MPDISDIEKKLTHKQRRAVLALAMTSTVEDAAHVAECSARSIFSWMKKSDAFSEYYDYVVGELHAKALEFMKASCLKAASCLVETIDDKTIPAYVRCKAASDLLVHTARFIENDELRRRLDALESRLADYEGK